MIKLADDARKTLLTWATEEARRRGDRRLGTDHLLLALLHDPDSGPARALGVDLESARAASDALDRAALTAVGIEAGPFGLPATQVSVRRMPPLTSGARSVLKRTIEEARGARETGSAREMRGERKERGARETRSAQEQETPGARETASAREQEPQGAREMRGTRTRRIETQHFLLALLTRERPDPAAELLAALRVDPKEVRARLTGPSR